MKRIVWTMVLFCSLQAAGETPGIKSAAQLQNDATRLLVTLTGIESTHVVSYKLYTVGDTYTPDGSGHLIANSQDVTSDYIDTKAPVVPAPAMPVPAGPVPAGPVPAGPLAKGPDWSVSQVTIRLMKPLGNSTYVLLATLDTNAYISAKIDPKGTISAWDMRTADHEVKISSPAYLGMHPGDKVTVNRARASVSTATGSASLNPVPYHGSVSMVETDGAFVKLDRRLPAGQTSSLSLVGGALPAEGKIDLSGAPKNESDAYILAKASAVAAVHQASVFTLSGSVAPFHPALHSIFWGPIRFDPSTTFDVGLRSTKTANSVTMPAAFSKIFLFGLPSRAPDGDFRDMASKRPVGFNFIFGPRYETDRTFRRVNVLGEGRAELYLPWLSLSVEALQARASAQSPKYRDFLEGPVGGFQLAPYVETDVGRHVNNETVTNSTTHASEIVPDHSIARLYGGVTGKVQIWRFQLSCDASVVNMFTDETIGYTTKQGVAFRKLSGAHPHVKPDFTFFLDPAHHTGLDITYENGRTAPNFEYLNTVNVGIKVIY